ncbi:MAG: GHKL domain-containing protein [Candidatus Omnitrophica bacterium]|nr:GHKL domain-containing protein [Candidatus Omnitrophota bacterium]
MNPLYFYPLLLVYALLLSLLYINSHLKRGTENRLLAEQRRYQRHLFKISKELSFIKEQGKLVLFVGDTVYQLMRVSWLLIYTVDSDGDVYRLARQLGKEARVKKIDLSFDAAAAEECAVLLPMNRSNRLIGFFMLGPKQDGSVFSDDDMSVLKIIADQTAVALENALYWEKEKQRIIRQEAVARAKSLDIMTGSLAHEIQNPLTGAMGNLEVLREMVNKYEMTQDDREVVEESFKYTLEPLHRVSKMVQVLNNYSKGYSVADFKVFNALDAVNDFKVLVQSKLKHADVQLTYEVDDDLPQVMGVPVWLQEALMNFVSNALHALRKTKDKRIVIRVLRHQRCVRLECEDNGQGIPADMLKEIFHPFVTTKSTSEGTGLGLSIVRRHIEAMGGDVWAESYGVGHGATFVVLLK